MRILALAILLFLVISSPVIAGNASITEYGVTLTVTPDTFYYMDSHDVEYTYQICNNNASEIIIYDIQNQIPKTVSGVSASWHQYGNDIYFYGDSITRGTSYCDLDPGGADAYRNVYGTIDSNRTSSGNADGGGWASVNGSTDFDSHFDNQSIFAMNFGVNDYYWNKTASWPTLDEHIEAMMDMASWAEGNGTKAYIIIPTRRGDVGNQSDQLIWINALVGNATANGYGIINAWDALDQVPNDGNYDAMNASNFHTDDIHWCEDGHAAFAQHAYDIINTDYPYYSLGTTNHTYSQSGGVHTYQQNQDISILPNECLEINYTFTPTSNSPVKFNITLNTSFGNIVLDPMWVEISSTYPWSCDFNVTGCSAGKTAVLWLNSSSSCYNSSRYDAGLYNISIYAGTDKNNPLGSALPLKIIENSTSTPNIVFDCAGGNTSYLLYHGNATATDPSDASSMLYMRDVNNCQQNWTNSSGALVTMKTSGDDCWIDQDNPPLTVYGYYTIANYTEYEIRMKRKVSDTTQHAIYKMMDGGTTVTYNWLGLSVNGLSNGALMYDGAAWTDTATMSNNIYFFHTYHANSSNGSLTTRNATTNAFIGTTGYKPLVDSPTELDQIGISDFSNGAYTVDHYHNWFLVCNETCLDNISYGIDTLYSPGDVITQLISPSDEQVLDGIFNYANVSFQFKCSGSHASYSANLTLDGVVNVSGISVSNNTIVTQNVTSVPGGRHSWTVTCWNGGDNNTATTRHFNITQFWLDEDWNYCKEIDLSGTFSANYSHLLVLNSSNFDYDNAQVDLDDLRFYEGGCYDPNVSMGSLGIWNHTIGANSSIWFKTETVNAPKVAMYYGNPSASGVWSGYDTFLLFDNFNAGSLNTTTWASTGSPALTFTGGYLQIDGTATKGIFKGIFSNNSAFGKSTEMRTSMHWAYDAGIHRDRSSYGFGNYRTAHALAKHYTTGPPHQNANFVYSNNQSAQTTSSTIAKSNDWKILQVERESGSNVNYLYDGSETTLSSNAPTGDLEIYYGSSTEFTAGYTYRLYLNWTFVRNYADTEPTQTIGTELSYLFNTTITAPSSSYETVNNSLSTLITATGDNIEDYLINIYYNNTLIKTQSATSVSLPSINVSTSFVAPLVVSNATNKTYSVEVDVNVSGYDKNTTESGNHTVNLWYTADRYSFSWPGSNETLEANNTINVATAATPSGAPDDVTYDNYSFILGHCGQTFADTSTLNTYNVSCDASLIDVGSESTFNISASHLQYNNGSGYVIYQDYYTNRTYNLSFNTTTESTSSKSLLINGTFASREYFIWLVDNDSISAASNTSIVYNITFYEEINLSSISIDSALMTYTLDMPDGTTKDYSITYSGAGTVSNASVVAYPGPYVANISDIEIYSKAYYTTRSRFLQDATCNFSEITNVSIYMLLDSASDYVIINVVDNGAPIEEAYIQILKYYATDNLYLNIEQKITNSEGQAAAYLDIDAYYKFSVYNTEGTLLYFSVGPEQVICDPSCSITLNIAQTLDLDFIVPNPDSICYGNLSSNSIIFTYADGTGATNNIRFLAWRTTNVSNNISLLSTVCNYTVSGSSASYVCALPVGENLSRDVYYCEVDSEASPWRAIYGTIIDLVVLQVMTDWFYVSIVMVLGLATAIRYPPAGAMLVPIGFVILRFVGVVNINYFTLIGLLVAGGFIAWIMSRGDPDG